MPDIAVASLGATGALIVFLGWMLKWQNGVYQALTSTLRNHMSADLALQKEQVSATAALVGQLRLLTRQQETVAEALRAISQTLQEHRQQDAERHQLEMLARR